MLCVTTACSDSYNHTQQRCTFTQQKPNSSFTLDNYIDIEDAYIYIEQLNTVSSKSYTLTLIIYTFIYKLYSFIAQPQIYTGKLWLFTWDASCNNKLQVKPKLVAENAKES